MNNPASDNQILNVCFGKGASVNEIFRIIKEATGFDSKPIYAPARKGEVYKIYISAEKARTIKEVTLIERLIQSNNCS